MGNPEKAYPCIHIAGTNGKGSVALIIASVLQEAGYKVGRFTSPHIESYRERFIINGEKIKESALLNYLDRIEQLEATAGQADAGVTEFELLTALAFQYFKDSQIDIAVVETGLGGLYDSTNVIVPLLSVITGVDYDHQSYLGNSLEEIALNKAGIIKAGVPVVVGDMDIRAGRVIKDKACQEQAMLYHASACQAERISSSFTSGQVLNINCNDIYIEGVKFSLLGDFQLRNLAAAITALVVLKQQGYNVTGEHIARVLPGLKHPGRMELIRNNPPIILDVAHNPQAARSLAGSLDHLFPNRQRVMVCGILDDKNSRVILQELGRNCRVCVVTRPDSERASKWQQVAEEWQTLYPEKELRVVENIEEAVNIGFDSLKAGEYLLLAGSFYILNHARPYLMSI